MHVSEVIPCEYSAGADTTNHRIVLLSGTIMRFITILLASLLSSTGRAGLPGLQIPCKQYLQLEPNLQK